jgi:hypothetical protein
MTSPNAAASPVVPSSQPMAARARQGLRAARVAEHRGVAVAHGEFAIARPIKPAPIMPIFMPMSS